MPCLGREDTLLSLERGDSPLLGSSSGESCHNSAAPTNFAPSAAPSGGLTATYGATGLILTSATGIDMGKDPERSPLLPTVLLPQPPWAGMTTREILALADDPFWCRIRATLFASFWIFLVLLIAAVAVIVATDPQPCSARIAPTGVPLPTLHAISPGNLTNAFSIQESMALI